MSNESPSRTELAAALSAALLDPAEAQTLHVHGDKDAAVLIAVYPDGDELRVVLTRRRDDLRLHAGQVSFPGGRQDPGEDLRTTALREACEEIGLDADGVEILGALTPTPTLVTGFSVYPFVGLIEPGQTWTPSAAEVAEILEPSLSELRSGYAERPVDTERGVFSSDTYLLGDDLVWGATARIISELLRLLAKF